MPLGCLREAVAAKCKQPHLPSTQDCSKEVSPASRVLENELFEIEQVGWRGSGAYDVEMVPWDTQATPQTLYATLWYETVYINLSQRT